MTSQSKSGRSGTTSKSVKDGIWLLVLLDNDSEMKIFPRKSLLNRRSNKVTISTSLGEVFGTLIHEGKLKFRNKKCSFINSFFK